MATRRGKYDKSGKIELTDQEIADHHIALWAEAIPISPNLPALVYALRIAKPAVRKRVIDHVFAPISHKTGRPKRAIPDEDFLQAVECVKLDLASRMPGKITDRRAIIASLETGRVVMGRDPATPFDASSKAGKHEIGRLQATVVRARKARKSKITRA